MLAKSASHFALTPEAPHAFDNQLADDRTREILRAALDFLRWHLGLGGPSQRPTS